MEQGPADVGERHAPEHLPTVGPQADRRHLLFRPDRLHHRDQFPHHQRQGHKRRREDEPRPSEDHLHRQRGEGRPEEPLPAEDQHQRQAGDHRGDGEGDVEQRHQQRSPRKAEAGDEPGRRDAEDRVDEHGDGGDGERQPDGVPRVGVVGQCLPPRLWAIGEGIDKHTRQRRDDEQADGRHRTRDEEQAERACGGGGVAGFGGHRGGACHWALRARRCWRTLTTMSIDSDMPRRTTAIAVASA